MNCLIVAATTFEIAPFLEYFRQPDQKIRIEEIDILITGIGLTATTYSLLTQLTLKKPGLVIQAGIGGCFDNNMKLGDVVIVNGEAIADQGVQEEGKFNNIFDLKFQSADQFPYKMGGY